MQKVALSGNNTMKNYIKTKLDRTWFSRQETERVYSYNLSAHIGHCSGSLKISYKHRIPAYVVVSGMQLKIA